jgi:hypothetical protein
MAKDFEEYKFEEHRMDREYVIAADWAKAQDFTVITVLDVTQFPMKPGLLDADASASLPGDDRGVQPADEEVQR